MNDFEPNEPDNCGAVYTDPVRDAARNIFGISSLYPWQRLVIANIMESAEAALTAKPDIAVKNSEEPSTACCASADYDRATECAQSAECSRSAECGRDPGNRGKQIVLLPTGAGKSLCFMIPAVLFPRPTLIIYPLLALMSDQLRRIRQAGLDAAVLRGQQSAAERESNYKKLEQGAKILIANPEVLQSPAVIERLKKYRIMHAAIDEAHCIAEWGDSFRPAYTTLGSILRQLNVPVVTAFTATASPPVLERIRDVLFAPETAYLIRSSSDRQNIAYRVHRSDAKRKTVLQLVTEAERPALVFCGTRVLAQKTAYLIRELLGRDAVRFYHAGLSKEEKKDTETWFYPRTDAILCCTCAFGMGIDKPDIRTVIHLEAPPTVESYIQEAGRAGRDGRQSQAILLWSTDDSLKAKKYSPYSRERILADFAEAKSCRRQVLLDALAAERTACSGCDVCEAAEAGTVLPEISAEGSLVRTLVARNKNRWTVSEAAEILADKMNTCSPLRIWDKDDFRYVIEQLVAAGILTDTGTFQRNRLSFPGKTEIRTSRRFPPRKRNRLLRPKTDSPRQKRRISSFLNAFFAVFYGIGQCIRQNSNK
ncbi:RecQ family ATP-dependent DNA helicase [Treponema brennaborense]|uniref:DNA 3'-5' helicase n=1 Tax=Treponema brennaborense (strain DSM 12168 / CIP 105900 / DD5/3) TaxID=906968 RepID=F4LPU2_TREBD|nr:RecQ family ATP-dependent DNA helicase [Treponema brennaborense]AEE16034.1 ATP-dependent DNA helicase, RecQ family [Treponema brennaborense DSM 12168]